MNARTLPFWMTVIAAAALALGIVAAPLAAQTQAAGSDRVVVPLSHPTQPARVNVSMVFGSITVRAYNGQSVVISTSGGSGRHERPLPPEAQGMHRLTLNPAITADEDDNVVNVHMSLFDGGGNVSLEVPVNTSLKLHTVNGGQISVTGVHGDLNVSDVNGEINLNHVSGSILASALNGRIRATVSALDPSKPSSFSSMNGTIDVTLPAATRANLRMRTDHGDIYIDNGFNFQVRRSQASTRERGRQGMVRVRINRTIEGVLNGGGTEIRFTDFNGSIYVRKGR
jgi:hypothetical protein